MQICSVSSRKCLPISAKYHELYIAHGPRPRWSTVLKLWLLKDVQLTPPCVINGSGTLSAAITWIPRIQCTESSESLERDLSNDVFKSSGTQFVILALYHGHDPRPKLANSYEHNDTRASSACFLNFVVPYSVQFLLLQHALDNRHTI